MKNAYEILGIEPRLVMDREYLYAVFREVGKSVHPDAGGDELRFSELQLAMDILQSPSKRLSHWLEIQGLVVEPRGSIGPATMDLFARVGKVTQQAESFLRKRQAAKSALGLALLEREGILCREAVEQAIAWVEQAIAKECDGFTVLESAVEIRLAVVSETARNLTFMEKWRASLKALFARLI